MTTFTDIFIKRPVLATVISLLILLVGLRAIFDLAVRQFPKMENTVITIQTSYVGANADVVQGFVTIPLEKSIASAEGIDYMTSSSTQGGSEIKAYIKLDYNPDIAFTNVMSKVAEARGQSLQGIDDPVLTKDAGSAVALMFVGFNSTEMTLQQITDYITRVVQPKLETVAGVSQVQIFGGSTFAMRVWLDPKRIASLNLTPSDISEALLRKNYLSAAGKTKGYFVVYNLYARTDLHTVDEFKNIVIKTVNGVPVHLSDVARVELGSKDYDSNVIFNGKKAIFIGISATPSANPLTVITDVRHALLEIQREFPPSLNAKVVYDATDYIRASIHEVIRVIIEAMLIVIVVIFLFLGALRSVLIPVVTIPLSLVGVCTLMLVLGYSINLLTLLAMVLAIGLVVDDAIVVVENIYRHIEEGMEPFDAAIEGARQIALPIVSMTITLAAVYAPIGFMGGLTGGLFKEFAFTLASSVIISGIIALTLSPMMCSRLLTSSMGQNRFVHWLDEAFASLKNRYEHTLCWVLKNRPMMVILAITVTGSCLFLYANTPKELAPDEDQSVIFVSATAPRYANIDYVTQFTNQFNAIFQSFPEMEDYFIVNEPTNIFGGMILKPWDKRSVSQNALIEPLKEKLSQVAGLQTVAFPLPSLPVSDDGLPVQFVVASISAYPIVYELAQQLTEAARKSGLFLFVDNTLRFDQPQLNVKINRDKASSLGISMQDIGAALSTSFGGNHLNYFSMDGRRYEVIPQVLRAYRLNPYQLLQVHVRTSSGDVVPLSTVATIESTAQPNALTQFQQLNSATIQGLMMPGKSLGEGLRYLANEAEKILPRGVSFDFAGQSRQLIQEGNALVLTFFFAIVIIFLVLAAQFESFRDPLIILISVPMSICGALIPLNLGLATINIYTQIGLITLIGLISKHGILMVDFANQLQMSERLDRFAAIQKAAAVRLRPILMTTAAMVLGVLPLILAEGAGAASRFDIGIVIAMGMLIGTGFTLFVVPTMYTFFAKAHHLT